MAGNSSLTPQKESPFSALSMLIMKALRRFGDFNPGTVEGETNLMFMDFANEIIEDIRLHPYWDGSTINYYIHLEEKRPIPDQVVVNGLLAKYSEQQDSDKKKMYEAKYLRSLNMYLYERAYGLGKITINKFDAENDYDNRVRS